MPVAFHHRAGRSRYGYACSHLLDVNEFEHRLEIHQGEVNHHPPSAIPGVWHGPQLWSNMANTPKMASLEVPKSWDLRDLETKIGQICDVVRSGEQAIHTLEHPAKWVSLFEKNKIIERIL